MIMPLNERFPRLCNIQILLHAANEEAKDQIEMRNIKIDHFNLNLKKSNYHNLLVFTVI